MFSGFRNLPERHVATEDSDEHIVLIEQGLNLSTDELLVGFIMYAPPALHSELLNEQQEHFFEVHGHD